MSWIQRLIAAACCAVASMSFACPPIVYVDASASPDGDGESWVTAFQDLQDALALARGCGGAVAEIYVAEGVYTPAPPEGDPDLRFQLVDGVSLYGGFPAGGAPFEQRDPGFYPTTLSGELGRYDSRQILKARDLSVGATIDGFTIRDAWDDRRLGGGGGAEVVNATATFVDCDFLENHAERGGALLVQSSVVRLTGCRLNGNDAYEEGGAVNSEDSKIYFETCELSGNTIRQVSYPEGGALFAETCTIEFHDCEISDNSIEALDVARGGALYLHTCDVLISGGAARDNSAVGPSIADGGFLYAFLSSVHISDSSIRGNSVFSDDGKEGGYGAGGALRLSSADLVVHNSIFENNAAESGYRRYAMAEGGAVSSSGQALEFVGCAFIGNSTTSDFARGGAIYAGVHIAKCVATNCTFVRNAVSGAGSAMYVQNSGVISNSILWDDTMGHVGGSVSIDYCNANNVWYGGTNTLVSPQFVDEENGDYRLSAGSPMIDAGNTHAVPADVTTDLAGLPRFHDDPSMLDSGVGDPPVVDIGAYEFQGDSVGEVFTLIVEPDLLIAGGEVTITAMNGLPNARAHALFSTDGIGHAHINKLNLVIDLLWAERIGSGRITNHAGHARWNRNVSRQAAGRTVWIQAVQQERKTNVVMRKIE